MLPWLGIREGQEVELKCVGIDSAGAEHVVLVETHNVTAAEVGTGLSVPMLRQKLLGLKTDSPLTVTLRVVFGQAVSPVAPVLFPVLILNVFIPVTSENFETVDLVTVPPGGYLDIPSMRITNLSGPGTLSIWDYGPKIPGQVDGKGLYSRGVGQRTRLDLRSSYSKITFWHWETQLPDNYVHFYNEKGNLLGSQVLQLSYPGSPVQVVFSDIGIKRIEIQHTSRNDEGIQLDNFTFTP